MEDLVNNSDGIADAGEYIAIPLTNDTGGQGNFTFTAWVDESGNNLNDWISVYISGNDTVDNPITGGAPGLDSDFISWQTRLEQESMIEDLWVEELNPGDPFLVGVEQNL